MYMVYNLGEFPTFFWPSATVLLRVSDLLCTFVGPDIRASYPLSYPLVVLGLGLVVHTPTVLPDCYWHFRGTHSMHPV